MEDRHWYVLRDLKRPNAKEPAYLQLRSEPYRVEKVFTPMVTRERVRKGRKEVLRTPYLSDLVFAYDSRERLDRVVAAIPTLQYRFVKGGAQNEPMMVRDKEMDEFVAVVETGLPLRYYAPEEVSPAIYGKTVRVIGGALDGRTGRLLSSRGKHPRRLIIELGGILSAAVEFDADYVVVI